MALTDHCDVFGAVHEDAFNRIFGHLMRQRPSLFNYGTRFFVTNPQNMCHEITPHPEVLRRHNPLMTHEAPLPIPGTGGLYGMEFCAQLVEAKIDFHPQSMRLPPELDPLPEQQASLSARFCVGVLCPDKKYTERIGDALAKAAADPKDDPDGPPPVITPLPGERVHCFCLEIFATLRIERVRDQSGDVLVPRLEGLEIVDLRPEGLENALECYVATTLRLGILPKMRFAVDAMIAGLGSFMGLVPALTPLSGDVPHNPAIEDDQLKLFVDMGF